MALIWIPSHIILHPPALELPSSVYLQTIPTEKLTIEQYNVKIKADAEGEAQMFELEIDLKDAMSPVYDQLKLAPMWWLLELLPVKHFHQRSDRTWTSGLGFNMG